jgi:very-short-patch-repair endonuclease/plasmid maintenance system killer protein
MARQPQTQTEFISKAKKLHNNFYDYSKVNYIKSTIEVQIICPEHGKFPQTPKSHIASRKSRGLVKPTGCPECGELLRVKKIRKEMKSRKITTKIFIKKSKKIFGNKFYYKKVKYKEKILQVIITCKKHGDFKVRPASHYELKNGGCDKCWSEDIGKIKKGIPSLQKGISSKWTQKTFIKKCKEVHNNYYDYSMINFVVTNGEINIICPKHKKFPQMAYEHLRGRGCEKCGRIETGVKKRIGFTKWLKEAKKMHNNYYSYDKNSFTTSKNLVKIKCPKHGWYRQNAGQHAYANSGCDLCGNLRISESRARKLKDFIKAARKIHGRRYDYSNIKSNLKTGIVICDEKGKVNIICKIHGEFNMDPTNHSALSHKQGCEKCIRSKGEEVVRMLLAKYKIKFKDHWRDHNCKDVAKLIFDFYIPDRLTIIEYDGPHHFRPIKFYQKMTDEQALKNFRGTVRRDKIKDKWCKKNGISMLRIPYTSDVKNILMKELNLVK